MPASASELIERFVDDLTDCVVVTLDVKGHVLSWNAGARALLGYEAGEVVERDFAVLYSKADSLIGRSNDALKEAVQWGRHESTTRLIAKDGTPVQAHIILRPLSDSRQRLSGFGLLAWNIDRDAKPLPKVEAAKEIHPSGGAKILMVDDDQILLETAVEQLQSLGYEVVPAVSAAEALAALERHDDIDLLFTDVVMPGDLTGRVLAEKATELRPGLKVLFASGYFEGALIGKGELEPDVKFIAKPFRRKALADKIAEVLKSPH